MFIKIGAASKPSGTRKSKINEDAFAYLQYSDCTNDIATRTAILVADGMGALDEPSKASSLAIRSALRLFAESDVEGQNLANNAILAANESLLKEKPPLDLGSTLTIVLIQELSFFISHIGDNRLYHIRDGNIDCLTADHSALAKKLGVANPSRAAAKNNKKSKKLLLSLGEKSLEDHDLFNAAGSLSPGDILILCSDGLWTELSDSDIVRFANSNSSPELLATQLVEAAYDKDQSDDITAVTVVVSEST